MGWVDPPSKYVPDLSEDLDRMVLRALDPEPERRFGTAEAMAKALELAEPPAPAMEVGAWVVATASEALRERQELQRRIETLESSRWSARGRLVRPAVLAGVAVVLTGATAIGLNARSAHERDPITLLEMAKPAAILENYTVPQANPIRQSWTNVQRSPSPEDEPQTKDARPLRSANTDSTRRRPHARQSRPQPADNCNPPYSVNEYGIRIYKRSCLRK